MMHQHDQEDRVRQILSDLTAVPVAEIKIGDRLREDLGLDSVGSMELLSMLAEEFDIDVEMEEAAAVADVAGLMALARRHLE
ncbi:MAG: acyl carrier protein [Pseudomonadota bacterium]|nr:acyl carrier protein [Pseudomonadota bacterium]